MNLAAVRSAELLGEGSAAAVIMTRGPPILQYVLPVVRRLRYHLSPGKGDQSTARSAIPRRKNQVKFSLGRDLIPISFFIRVITFGW